MWCQRHGIQSHIDAGSSVANALTTLSLAHTRGAERAPSEGCLSRVSAQ